MSEGGGINVLVYDDERNSASAIQERLEAFDGLSVTLLEEPADAVEGLEERRRQARTGVTKSDGVNPFDAADVLVVDYDLTGEPVEGGSQAETGERVAYLARCYSQCRTIVGLNQYSSRPVFDLTLLGHPGSWADLNISGAEIDNPALWGTSEAGYQPWWWPNLRAAPAMQLQRAAAVQNNLDSPVLPFVGLGDPVVRSNLSRKQLAWLSPGQSPHEVTFRDSIRKGRLGLKPRDELANEGTMAAVAAARISKWIDRLVVPGQNVLVDVAHLIGRYPSLLSSRDLTGLPLRQISSADLISLDSVEAHLAGASLWYPRESWLWPSIVDDMQIAENRDPFGVVPEVGRFCEDVSRFLTPDDSRPFSAEFEPFSLRYVAPHPSDRSLRAGPHGVDSVTYEPAVAYALV